MGRDRNLEIRLRMAAMAPASSYVSVQREELLADLSELLELRSRQASSPEPVSGALRRHPSAGPQTARAPRSSGEDRLQDPAGRAGENAPPRTARRTWP